VIDTRLRLLTQSAHNFGKGVRTFVSLPVTSDTQPSTRRWDGIDRKFEVCLS
jgi:hypothetical protein